MKDGDRMDYYIIFSGEIEQVFSTKLFNAIQNAPNQGATRIVLFFSSLGGNIHEGFLLASVIQNSKIPVVIHANNHIDSIANVIYLSAKERTAESYAKFYLHGATIGGNFDEKGMNDQLSAIKTSNSRIAYFISENSNLPLSKVQQMMDIGTTLSAQEALGQGIVKEIVHREIPQNAKKEEIIFVN